MSKTTTAKPAPKKIAAPKAPRKRPATTAAKRAAVRADIVADDDFDPEAQDADLVTASRSHLESMILQVTSEDLAALCESLLPSVDVSRFGESERTDRGSSYCVFSGAIELSPELALEIFRLNVINRPFNWGHGRQLAEITRAGELHPESWEHDVSTILIAAYRNDDDSYTLVLTDGQHRLAQLVLAYGTPAQVSLLCHYIEVAEWNKNRPPAEHRSFDTVRLKKPEEVILDDGEQIESTEIPLEQWLQKLEDEPRNANLAKTPEIEDWKTWPQEEPKRLPWFGLQIGVHPRSLLRADQNNKERSGADVLAMHDLTGNLLARIGLRPTDAASTLKDLGLRCKQVKVIPATDSEPERIVRGTLRKGGRFASPPGYPAYWTGTPLGAMIVDSWEAWQIVESELATVEVETPEGKKVQEPPKDSYAYSGNPAYSAYRDATTPARAKENPGRKISDQIIRAAVALRTHRRAGRCNVREIEADRIDLCRRLRHGVFQDAKGNWKADTVFTSPFPKSVDQNIDGPLKDAKTDAQRDRIKELSVRDYIAEVAGMGASPHPDILLNKIVTAWNRHKKLPYVTPSRFPGLDSEGMTEDDEKRRKGIDPERKQGARGKGRKKKA